MHYDDPDWKPTTQYLDRETFILSQNERMFPRHTFNFPTRSCILDTLSIEQVYNFIVNSWRIRCDEKRREKYIEVAKEIFINSPDYAVKYATLRKARWHEAEPTILNSNNPSLLYHYALNVIQGRWEEAEPIISTDVEIAYEYAKNILKGRFPAAEHLFTDIDYEKGVARNYVYELHHDTQNEIIQQIQYAYEAKKAYDFAKNTLKGRYAEGEKIIKNHEYWWEKYQQDFLKEELENELKKLQKKIKQIESQLEQKT